MSKFDRNKAIKVWKSKDAFICLDENLEFWEKGFDENTWNIFPSTHFTSIKNLIVSGELKNASSVEIAKRKMPSPSIIRTEKNAGIYDTCVEYVEQYDDETFYPHPDDKIPFNIFAAAINYIYADKYIDIWNFISR